MSGRVRTRLADGRIVRGFRKTLRRNPRLGPQDKPTLRFTFVLPALIGTCTLPGEYAGAILVDADGMVTVHGRERDYVLRKGAEFLKRLAAGSSLAQPITGTLFCPAHPGPTPSSPLRRGYSDSYTITVTCGAPTVSITRGTASEPIVVA